MNRALITGANRGIGLALTEALVKRGVFVYAGARHPATASELERLRGGHPELLQIVPLDVASAESVSQCAGKVQGIAPSLDILVNHAAIFLEGTQTPLATAAAFRIGSDNDTSTSGHPERRTDPWCY